MRVVLLLLTIFVLSEGASFGGNKKRVIAWAQYEYRNGSSLQLFDSVSMIYGGSRGSTFDYEDLSYCFDYFTFPGVWGDVFAYEVQRNGLIGVRRLRVNADSILSYAISQDSQKLFHHYTDKYGYNSDGSLSWLREAETRSDYGWNQSKFYDASGHCVKTYEFYDRPTGPDTVWVRYLFYNNNDQLIRDSTFRRRPFTGRPADEIGSFSYSGPDVTQILWKAWDSTISGYRDNAKISYAYDVFYNTKSSVTWSTTSGSPTVMKLVAKDSFGYHPGCVVPIFYQSYGTANNLASPLYRYVVNHWTPSGYPDSVTYYRESGNVLNATESKKVYYDAENNPLRIDHSPMNLPYYVVARRELFYYENYKVGIREEALEKSEIIAAPNPNAGTFFLNYSSSLSGQRVQIALSSLSGQLLRTQSTTLRGTQYEVSLGADLSPGHYVLVIARDGGVPMFSGTIEKQ